LVPHFTGGVKTRLGSVDEGLHEGILFADQDSRFVQQDDMFVQFLKETIAKALEHFNKYMRAEFLEWYNSLLMRRMEKMEAQDLKAAEERSTREECEEYGHVQGKPRINASSSIQDLVPLCTQFKDFMDEQAKINKDTSLSSRLWRKYWRI
jgi:hypothetical protein